MLSRAYFKCCPWWKWRYHSWENNQGLWKIILWSTKKTIRIYFFYMHQKGSGPLASEQSFTFFLPKMLLIRLYLWNFPEILIYWNVSTLLGWELRNWSLWRSLCSEVELTLCILGSWKGLSPSLSHKWVFLKYSVKMGNKQQLLFGSIFDTSVICTSASDSCRKADNYGLFLCLQQRQLNWPCFQK